MSSWRARRSPEIPHLQGSGRSSRAGTPSRCPRSPPLSAAKRRSKSSPVPRVSVQKCCSRVLDVTPLFAVEGAVRYVEVINERTAWTVECGGAISVRSIPKGSEMRQLPGRKGVFCICLLFVGKTGKVWAAFSDGFIHVYDVNTFSLENTFVQHTGAVECIVEMENRIYTGGRDWKIYQWDPETYCYERQFAGHGNTVRCLCPYIGSTGAVLFTGSDDGTVKAWNPYPPVKQSKENNPCVHTFVGHARGVLSLEIVGPNNQLWSGGEDTTIRVWDLQTLDCVAVLENHTSPIACLSLVQHRVWSGDKHGRILLWDLGSLSPLQELSRQMRVEHRSVFTIRKMVPVVVWKVWTTGSAGHIHCWNAETMPLMFDSDPPGEMLPRTDEENMRALERDNETLRAELAKMTRRLEKECAHAMLDTFNEVQNQQLLMDTNDSLRRQLRKPRQLGATADEGTVEQGGRSPYAASATPQVPRLDLSTPSSDASHPRGEKGETPLWEPITMPLYRSDVALVITKHERFFPGSAWPDIVPKHASELRLAFTREAAQALGIPEDRLHHVFMQPNPQGLLATLDVPHGSAIPAEEVQRSLQEHPFLPVLNLYGTALATENERLKEALIHARHANQSARRSKRDDTDNKPNDASIIREKNDKIADLSDEIDNLRQKNLRLRKELQELNEQLVARGPASHINVQEEYDALKKFVDSSLKPLISRLKRANGEKELDLRANEERIKQLLRDREQLQKQLVAREPASHINVQEEYDALKKFVDSSLKPLISRLKRANGEKDLDLRANEERIKQLLRDREQLQKQLVAREPASHINVQEEYDALKKFVDSSLKPLISRLKRANGEKELDLRANEERIKQLLRDREQLQKQLVAREPASHINVQEEYDALKKFVDSSLKPLISRLKRANGEKDLDLRANEERIKQLLRDREQLQKQLVAREPASHINVQEEYDALKKFVDSSLKPLISRLKRANGEKELDLRANEERIKQLLRDREQLQKQLVAREPASHINVQEEYDALKKFVDSSLKPLISRLKRANGEKELDLRANEERIKQLLRDREQLQKQLVAREPASHINVQEEYDALKKFVDSSLKPLISRLKRANGEKDLDLRANEERIKQLLRDREQLQKQLVAREPASHINVQEEYDALKKFVDSSLKPLISRLKRANGEKELDLRANEERIRQLLSECGQLCSSCGCENHGVSGHLVVMGNNCQVLLNALVEAEESARLRENDLLALVDSLQNAVDRYVVEKEELVASLTSVKGELREALNERDAAMSDGKLLQEECVALRDQLRGELLPHFPVGEHKLLVAYLDEVQRRRAAENELYRGLVQRVRASW